MESPADAATSTFLSFSTAQIPVSHRLEHWESYNAKVLMGLDIRTLDDSPLRAEEVTLHCPTLRFARVKGSPQVIERSQRFITTNPTDDVVMFFILGGEAFFYHSTGMILLKPGQAILCDLDRPFLRGFSYGVSELVLTVPRTEYVRLSRGKPLKEPVIFDFATAAGTPGKDFAASSLASLINSALARKSGNLEQAENEAFSLVEQMLRGSVGADSHSAYQRALREVDHRFADPALDRSQVAAAAGISERQLTRLFAAQGESFADHLLARRLQAAEALLSSEPYTSIADITRRCGFTSPSHFARAFKARTGVLPSELQRASRA
ncbi:AraC family transcriptional regulator [Kocuria sp. CPCC 205281]